ncbi:peptidoglycan-binding protein [Streptomyces sp. WZ-12]|uniref:peptidoglycan-binding protein n=1 Tax=Streptomyces sp. WZ-12 TaxID=3030210 RepID=UPI002380C651|nr:peptidoglycan-binding protein [Streptomyces sp. WZ-12]
MSTRWIPEAEDLGNGRIGGDMDSPGRPARVVWHSTESGDGDQAFDNVASWLIQSQAQPHFLYDPSTDRLGQFGAMDFSARALRNDGSTRTNRTGSACIQIEVLARAASPFTDYWKPGPNFQALLKAIRSWGIPDEFPMGDPPSYPGGSRRDRGIWLSEGGHYCHSNVPGNDHGDPGAIDPVALFKAAPGSGQPSKPKPPPDNLGHYQVTIDGVTYGSGAYGSHVTRVGQALVAKGFGGSYAEGPGPRWTDADTKAYAAYQKSLGFTGKDADGIPGPKTLRALIGSTNTSFPGRDAVRYGSSGPQVLAVDQALTRHGYGRYLTHGASDYYGNTTRAAVRAFQLAQGWSGSDADGNVGPATWRRLMQ